MRVSDIMTRDPVSCTRETSLQDAARAMLTNDCGSLPVCESSDSKHIVGMITDRDIAVRGVASGRNPLEMKVGEVMSHPVATISAEASLEECLRAMEENQVRRIPVVESGNLVVGVVAQADVARHARDSQVGELVQEISEGIDIGHR